ncbi:MAG: hypothetical protein HC817_10000 [Saprospiraceae bacterium]|nr:hypothetical protein [Saprospiraceae bacterium]
MAQKDNSTSNAAANAAAAGLFGDMSMLREIIMGPKVVEYNDRFNETDALIKKNEEATQQNFDKMTHDMNARFDKLEQLLLQKVQDLEHQIKEMSHTDRSKMANLLVELSQKLKD